jgi:translation initiation factor IF-3
LEFLLKKSFEPFVIDYADFSTLNLLDENGDFHKEVSITKAKEMAKNTGMDLVCFKEPDNKNLALCKIINYGKWKFQKEKSLKQKKKESSKSTKEIRVSPVISDHDLKHKMKQASDFINNGDEVLLSMRLKGRQMSHMDEAEARMNEIASSCENSKEVSRKKTRNTIMVRISKDKGDKK